MGLGFWGVGCRIRASGYRFQGLNMFLVDDDEVVSGFKASMCNPCINFEGKTRE